MKSIGLLFIQLMIFFHLRNAIDLPRLDSKMKASVLLASSPSKLSTNSILQSKKLLLHRSISTNKEPHRKISPDLFTLGSATQELFDKQRESLGAYEQSNDFDLQLHSLPRGLRSDEKHFTTYETLEIRDAVAFAEFKMAEINALMEECISQKFDLLELSDSNEVKGECLGLSYQVLFFNYREGIRKIKDIFIELLKIKLDPIKDNYEDETAFFLDMLDDIVTKDFNIVRSINVCKKASKYYVSPRYFDKLMELAKPEIDALTAIHNRLRKSRLQVQEVLDTKKNNAAALEERIKAEADMVVAVHDDMNPIEPDELAGKTSRELNNKKSSDSYIYRERRLKTGNYHSDVQHRSRLVLSKVFGPKLSSSHISWNKKELL